MDPLLFDDQVAPWVLDHAIERMDEAVVFYHAPADEKVLLALPMALECLVEVGLPGIDDVVHGDHFYLCYRYNRAVVAFQLAYWRQDRPRVPSLFQLVRLVVVLAETMSHDS
jgi:hypothetical protein